MTARASARAQNQWGIQSRYVGYVVNRDGVVCAVAFTGTDAGNSGPEPKYSRRQKANTRTRSVCPGLRFDR